jgi:hypothetical protein
MAFSSAASELREGLSGCAFIYNLLKSRIGADVFLYKLSFRNAQE